jgi:hypothetical protein
MRMGGCFPDCRGTVVAERSTGADRRVGAVERSSIMEQGTKIVELGTQVFRCTADAMHDFDGHGHPGSPCEGWNALFGWNGGKPGAFPEVVRGEQVIASLLAAAPFSPLV